MNLNYAIFRSEPIYTLNDLAQIGLHNKREKKAYNSNPDIDKSKSKDNIEIIPLADKYVKGFYNLTKDYKKEHEERMKTMREDRKKTFRQMLDKSKSVVADELLFTATNTFFKDMNREDIVKWANTCMEFVYKDLGYTKEQILHAAIHMDEKTPHIHCVVVPLIRKYDKRTKTEKYTISKKQYIKDKYHARLISRGYDLERGIKGSDTKHIKIRHYKNMARRIDKQVQNKKEKIDKSMSEFEEKMLTTKETLFDKEYVKIRKDTFNSMKKVINATKQALTLQPKIENLFNQVEMFTQSHIVLEKENQSMKKEIDNLYLKNHKLKEENKILKNQIMRVLESIKKFFRKLLQRGIEYIKDYTETEVKHYYDNKTFKMEDVKDVAKATSREDSLFEYAKVPDYYKTKKIHYSEYEKTKDKDDFGLGM